MQLFRIRGTLQALPSCKYFRSNNNNNSAMDMLQSRPRISRGMMSISRVEEEEMGDTEKNKRIRTCTCPRNSECQLNWKWHPRHWKIWFPRYVPGLVVCSSWRHRTRKPHRVIPFKHMKCLLPYLFQQEFIWFLPSSQSPPLTCSFLSTTNSLNLISGTIYWYIRPWWYGPWMPF